MCQSGHPAFTPNKMLQVAGAPEGFLRHLMEIDSLALTHGGTDVPYIYSRSIACSTGKSMKILGEGYKDALSSSCDLNLILGASYSSSLLGAAACVSMYEGCTRYSTIGFTDLDHAMNLRDKRIAILEEVILSPEAISMSIRRINRDGGILSAIVVGFDGQEIFSKTTQGKSVLSILSDEYRVPTISVCDLTDVLDLTQVIDSPLTGHTGHIQNYLRKHSSQKRFSLSSAHFK